MARFELVSEVTVSAYTIVEADTLEEAMEISEGRDVTLGGFQSGADEDEIWVIDDADGMAQKIRES